MEASKELRMKEEDRKALLLEGSKYAQAAVKADQAGGRENEEKALQLYLLAAEICSSAIKGDPDAARRKAVAAKANSYLDRAQAIHDLLQKEAKVNSQPQPQVKGSPMAAAASIPKQAQPKSPQPEGNASNPAQKEPFVDPEIAEGLRDVAVEGAIKLKESGIHIVIGDAVRFTFNKAVELDRKYEVHQKAISAAKAGLAKAWEIDKQYEIHQKAGEVISTGFSVAGSAIKTYMNTPYNPPASPNQSQSQTQSQSQSQFQPSSQSQIGKKPPS